MRWSNRKAVNYLLEHGYDEIWLKAHGRRQDLTYCQGAWYRALDLWNLFDGVCIDEGGIVTFLQIKTNAWAKEKPLKQFAKDHKNIKVLSINVKGEKNKWNVYTKEY